MSRGILVSHPFGNANVRNAAQAFAEHDALAGFRTCINWPADSALANFLPEEIVTQLQRRTFPPDVSRKTRTQPLHEFLRLVATRFHFQRWITHETGAFSVDAVTQRLDRKVAAELRTTGEPPSAIYAYEDGAAASFAAAKERGIRCFYDLPIGYWKSAHAILREEAERQPEWAETLTGVTDSSIKLQRKNDELNMADAIFVASQFTRQTLAEHAFPPEKIRVISYGCPPPATEPAESHNGPLRVLFAGSLGQRKGTSYLLSAVERLGKHATLTLLGSRPFEACAPLDRAVKRHRWLPTLPHAEVLREMRRHDVLVFPSLFEGFGLVITEALSQGIPVITTPHTAGPDLLTGGTDGFIVPIRDADAIFEKLQFFIDHPAQLREMKAAALHTASQLTWARYRSHLIENVFSILL